MKRIVEARAGILDRLLKVLAVIGGLAYVPSMYASLVSGMRVVAAVDSLAYAAFVAAAFSRRAGYALKLGLLLALSLLVGAIVLYATGPFGAGYVWILYAIFSAALLGSTASTVATAVAGSAILGGYALLVFLDLVPNGQPLFTILVVAANLALVAITLGAAARRLVEGFERALAEENRLAERLGQELEAVKAAELALRAEIEAKEALLKELNHRVRNNMQALSSLLRIEAGRRPGAGDGKELDRLTRMVRALSIANEVFLSSPETGGTELYALVAALVAARRAAAAAGGAEARVVPFSLVLPAEEASSLAVAVEEILEALSEGGKEAVVEFEGEGASATLAFSWTDTAVTWDEALGARLAADPAVAGLVPAGLVFEPASAGGSARLLLRLD